jgi:chaperonin GroES
MIVWPSKRVEEERTSSGGIVIADSTTVKPIRGGINSIGKGTISENGELRPLDVKAGGQVNYWELRRY